MIRRYVILAFLVLATLTARASAQDAVPPPVDLAPSFADRDFRPETHSPEGHDLLDVYVPEGEGPFPVVVFFHGGGLKGGIKTGKVKDVAAALTRRGIIAVLPNYRLSPAVRHPAHTEDAAAAVAYVRAHAAEWGGDPARIVLSGHSAGGYLAALLAADHRYLAAQGMDASELAGVALVSGLLDVDALGRAQDIADVWGEDAAGWVAASPVHYLDKVRAPHLLLVAERDDEWRRQQHEDYALALAGRGLAAEYIVAPARDHRTLVIDVLAEDDRVADAIAGFVAGLNSPASQRSARACGD